MNYYFHPGTKDLIGYDEDTQEFLVLIPVSTQPSITWSPKVTGKKTLVVKTIVVEGKTKKRRGRPPKESIEDKDAAWENYRAPISRDNFKMLKTAQMEDVNAVQAAAEINQPVQEVNFVFRCKQYEDYVSLSRREALK